MFSIIAFKIDKKNYCKDFNFTLLKKFLKKNIKGTILINEY